MTISPFSRARVGGPGGGIPEDPSTATASQAHEEDSIGDLISTALADISVSSMDDVAEGIRGGRLGGKGGPRKSARAPKLQQQTKTRANDNDTVAEKVRQAVNAGVTASAVTNDAFEGASIDHAHADVTGAAATSSIAPEGEAAPATAVKAWTVAPLRIKA